MTRTYEECMLAILASPEDDQLRRELATIVRTTDPAWAELIELEIDVAEHRRRRQRRDMTRDEELLLRQNQHRLSRNLDFYLGEEPSQQQVEFERGLPYRCTMNPYMFLEQGEYIMTRVAPLRAIEFYSDPEGAPFPAKELAASPLLARLDEIRFGYRALGEGDLEILVASPNLERVRCWWLYNNPVSAAVWEALAANPLTRKTLRVRSDYEVPSDGGPLGEAYGIFDLRPPRYFEMSAEGAELERRFGYQPWLHLADRCDAPDAHYWEAQRVLPAFVPGSPIDAPTPYGTGLWRAHRLEPRSSFDVRDYNNVHGACSR